MGYFVKCDICEGESEVPIDSGGTEPWGAEIIIPVKCPADNCQSGYIKGKLSDQS